MPSWIIWNQKIFWQYSIIYPCTFHLPVKPWDIQIPITESMNGRLLRLPFYYDLTCEEQDKIVDSIKSFLHQIYMKVFFNTVISIYYKRLKNSFFWPLTIDFHASLWPTGHGGYILNWIAEVKINHIFSTVNR